MFLVTKKNRLRGKIYEYVQVIENYRDKGAIKQRVIFNVGRKDQVDPAEIAKLVKVLSRLSEEVMVLNAVDPDMTASWSLDHGIPLLYHHLWKRAGLDEMIRGLARGRGYGFDVERALFLLVVNRLMDPTSELGISQWKERGLFLSTTPATAREGDFHDLELHHLYRTLDFLEKEKETIEMRLFDKTRTLCNSSVTLVFFDTTSTYYEGSGKHSDELLQYGRSKDHRGDRTQLVVGVLMDQRGIPLGCECVPGNTQDVTLIKTLMGKVKERFRLEDIVWVSDGGMTSEQKIAALKNLRIKFILGARMKNVKEVYEKVRDEKTKAEIMAALTSIPRSPGDQREPLGYYEFLSATHADRRYVIVYNPEEAERERKTREAVAAKLRETLTSRNSVKELIKNKKYRSYLAVSEGSLVTVDENKAKKDEAWDGLFVLQTDTDLPASQAVMRYKDLYQVEQAFATLKSRLDVRPIFHHKDRRIAAHAFVNVLALYLWASLLRLLKDHGMYAEKIAEALDAVASIRIVELTVAGKTYHLRTELPPEAQAAFRHVGLSPGKRLNTVTSGRV